MTRIESQTIPCPRCDVNAVPKEGQLCSNCRAEEMQEGEPTKQPAPPAAGQLPLGAPAHLDNQGVRPAHLPEPAEKAAAPASSGAPKAAAPPAAAAVLDQRQRQAPAQNGAGQARGPSIRVSKGYVEAPMKIVIYGREGVGKTRFGADAPDAIFLPAEVGSELFDVARLDDPAPPRSFEEMMELTRWLQTADHAYKTACYDTADAIEAFAFNLAVRKYNRHPGKEGLADNIEEVGGGYKKGYSASAELWRQLLAEIEKLRTMRNMHIVVMAHSKVVKFANPEGEDYDRTTLRLHPDAGLGPVKDWADAVLFADFVTRAKKAHKRARAKGDGGEERVLYTQFRATHDAKNRFDLPERIPLDWRTFVGLVEENRRPEMILQSIERALARCAGEQVTVRGVVYPIEDVVRQELAARPDTKRLAALKNRLEARAERVEEERAEREEAAAGAEAAQ